MSSIDPITLAVIANRLDSIVREMENTLLRTGRSAVLNMARDFSCALITSDNRLLGTHHPRRSPRDPEPLLIRAPSQQHQPRVNRHAANVNRFWRPDDYLRGHEMLGRPLDEQQ